MASALINAAQTILKPSTHTQNTTYLRPNTHRVTQWSFDVAPRRAAALSLRVRAFKCDPAKVAPQADRVLIRLEELPEKSSGGVLLPKSAVKFERYLMGEVLSVGSDVTNLDAGKKVLFSDINAYEVDLGTDIKHVFCKAGDLLAVVE